MPGAQQQYAHKSSAHAERVRNFVITHVRVVAQDKRHARAVRQFGEAAANFLAGVLGLEAFDLARIGMFERKRIKVARFEILPNAPAAQRVPAVIARDFVQPRGKWPRGIVRSEFLAHFHKHFCRRIFRIFAGRKHPPAKTENGRSVPAIQLAPGVGIARPDLGQQLRQFGFAHRPGRLVSVHRLIRRAAWEYFTTTTNQRTCLPGRVRRAARSHGRP